MMPLRVFPAGAINLIYYKRLKIFIEEVIDCIHHKLGYLKDSNAAAHSVDTGIS